MTDKTAQLKQIRDEILGLKESPLYEYRTQNHYFPVIGEGSHDAKIMFIGEAPGENEAKTARPFCGAAGRVLDELLAAVGLKRQAVYITNIVKDRPPDNRDPSPAEIEVYAPFLVRQISIIKPEIIATLGRFAMTFILNLFHAPEASKTISQLHGRVIAVTAPHGPLKVVALYHPAVALYNPNTRQTLTQDFQIFKQFM